MKQPLRLDEVRDKFDLAHLHHWQEIAFTQPYGVMWRRVTAMRNLAQNYRFNEPAITVVFETLTAQAVAAGHLSDEFTRLTTEHDWGGSPQSIAHFHALSEQIMSMSLGTAALAGSVLLLIDTMLQQHRTDIGLAKFKNPDAAEQIGELINGRSFGSIVWAAANNHRHWADWRGVIPTKFQKPSMDVIRDALGAKLDGRNDLGFNAGGLVTSVLAQGGGIEVVWRRMFAYANAVSEHAVPL